MVNSVPYPSPHELPWDGDLKNYLDQLDATVPNSEVAVLLAKQYGANILEQVPVWCFGDSYGDNADGSVGPVAAAFANRIAIRNRMATLNNKSVGGRRSDEILEQQVRTNWVAPGRGLVILTTGFLNDLYNARGYNANTAGRVNVAEAWRTTLAYLSAKAVKSSSDTGITYGPNWSSGVSSTSGSYFDLAWSGDTVFALVQFSSAAAGTLTFKDSSGNTVATKVTGGFLAPATGAYTFTGVVKLSGFGAGNHTVRGSIAGGSVTVLGYTIPSIQPPAVLWYQPGANGVPTAFTTVWAADGPGYQAAIQAVFTDFPALRITQVVAGTDFSYATMGSNDGAHLNDLGNKYVADVCSAALVAAGPIVGMNILTAVSPEAAYVPVTPAYTSPGAAVPATPGSFVATTGNQVSFTWTRPTDGGATLTGFIIESSPAGAGTWTTLATVTDYTATTYNATTGLTASTSYDFRIKATNSVGSSAPSATSTATAGSSPVTYTADTFTRADNVASMGVTETGGFAWAAKNSATFKVASNAAVTNTTGGIYGNLVVNDTVTDGSFYLTMKVLGFGGMIFAADVTATTGYMVTNNGSGAYAINKRTAAGAFTLLGSTTGVTPASGDQLRVIKSGSSIKVFVNGVQRASVTDATYNGTYSGLASTNVSETFDDWKHTNELV